MEPAKQTEIRARIVTGRPAPRVLYNLRKDDPQVDSELRSGAGGTEADDSGLGGMPKPLSFRAFSGWSLRHALMAASLLTAVPVPATAAGPALSAAVATALVEQANGEFRAFYAHQDGPLWITSDGSLRPAASELLRLISTADYDGLDPRRLGMAELEAAVGNARRDKSPAALARAELALSNALARYVEAMRSVPPDSEMLYEHPVLRPFEPTAPTVLRAAAQARSLEDYVGAMRWMHPLYAEIRRDLTAGQPDLVLREAAKASLQRVRAIPAPPWQRHVLIDIASARLWMYEGGRVVDSMRIVVGKPDTPTPIMAGYIRQAVLNPYWNVPEHLVRKTIAPNVLSQGVGYLRSRGYEVLSDWGDDAVKLDPASIDWRAVVRGESEVVVRQKPGGTNAMGAVKYEFPNPQGIYLHDTPEKNLMLEEARQFSNGCIRLEDAERFGRWLLGAPLAPNGSNPEQVVSLEQPVPIYITYLTVRPDGDRLVLGADPYGRDGAGPTALARVH